MAEKKNAPPVFDFLMSVNVALGHGPIKQVNAVYFKDKLGWVGPAKVDGATYIDKHELFGGDDGGEGGVSGTMEIYLGGWLQRMSGALSRRFGLTPATAPGYRGIAHLFFHGSRPPGRSMRETYGATPTYVTGSWDPDNGDPHATIDIENPSEFDNPDFWRDQIDSGLVTFRMSYHAATGSRLSWYLGTRVQYYDGDGNFLSQDPANGNEVDSHNDDDETRAVYFQGTIPPLTRSIKYAVISTQSTNLVILDQVEMEAQAGVLTNFFGDSFEHDDLDPGGNDGFRWSTHTPWYQGPKISATTEPVSLPNMTGVEALIWPIVGVNEDTGAFVFGSEQSAFSREDRLENQGAFNNVGQSVRDSIIGPDHLRNSRYSNEDIDLSYLPDANPALIIFECMTNTDWGHGRPVSSIDTESYRQAAITLQDEHFGISIRWNGQDKIDSFIGEILDHVKGMHFRHPQTGLWTLKLLRDDYVESECLVLDDKNCNVTSARVQGYGEVINVIKVQYTNPKTNKLESVEGHNLSNIAIQGGVIPDTRKYIGVRNPWLAQTIADRDAMESGATLTVVELDLPRSLSEQVAPGDVVSLTNSRYRLEGFFRINEVDPGTMRSKTTKVVATTDVFSVATISRTANPTVRPVFDTELPPSDIASEEGNAVIAIFSAPYIALGSEAPEPPFNRLVAVAADPGRSYNEIQVQTFVTDSAGNQTIGTVRRIIPPQYTSLDAVLEPASYSNIPAPIVELAVGLDASSGALMVLGSLEGEHEIVMLESYVTDGSDAWRVIRACYDTIPREWPIGTPVFSGTFLRGPFVTGTFSEGDELEFYVLPSNNQGTLDVLNATPVAHEVQERSGAPIRPANVSIDGNLFDDTVYAAGAVPTNIPITWANRNRLSEDGVVPSWDDSNITPETGQTTTVRVWYGAEFDQLEFEETDLAGTSYNLPSVELVNASSYEVELVSVRDGIESYQSYRASLTVTQTGFGFNFGFNYGGGS